MQISKTVLLANIMLICGYISNAEEGTYGPAFHHDFYPPSPNAAALGVYGEYDVSLYTGTPNISVPLYNLKTRNITVPISLSYNAMGHRVADKASWVGLGWTLNAGGVITRTLAGRRDEEPNNGYLAVCDEYNFPNPTNFENLFVGNWYDDGCYTLPKEIAEGRLDGQPDMFAFNFMGRTGKFFFDSNGNIRVSPYQGLEITEYIGSVSEFQAGNRTHIFSFVIRDEMGFSYEFSDIVRSTADRGEDKAGVDYVSAWYLTKVTDPNGRQVVEFEYQDYHHATFRYSDSFQVNATDGGTNLNDLQGSASIHYNAKVISKITSAEIDVHFVTNSSNAFGNVTFEREDNMKQTLYTGFHEFDPALSKIVVESVSGGWNKTFDFDYGYFNAEKEADFKRLKLNSVAEGNLNSTKKLPAHWFEYNEQVNLPSRHYEDNSHFSQDHYGFYNGAGNSVLYPAFEYADTEYPGANREPSVSHMQANIIEAIHYPTGGYTEFEYGTNSKLVTTSSFEWQGAGFVQDKAPLNANNFGNAQSLTFTVEGQVEGRVSRIISLPIDDGSCPILPEGEEEGIATGTFTDNGQNVELNFNGFFFPGHTYVITAEAPMCGQTVTVSAQKRVKVTKTETVVLGGLKVESIKNFNRVGKFLKGKEYIYSGAKNFDVPSYSYTTSYQQPSASGGKSASWGSYRDILTWNVTSSSKNNLSFDSGVPAVYSTVRENIIDEDGNIGGYKIYKYRVHNVTFSRALPYTPPRGYDYKGGQLEWEENYRADGRKLMSVQYVYNDDPSEYYIESPALASAKSSKTQLGTTFQCSDYYEMYIPAIYTVRSDYARLDHIKKRWYDPNTGAETSSESESYSYYLPNFPHLKTVSGAFKSNVELFEYSGESPSVPQTMKNRNMIGYPVKKTYRTGFNDGTGFTYYTKYVQEDSYHLEHGNVVLETREIKPRGNSDNSLIMDYFYNDMGDIIEIEDNNGFISSWIWDDYISNYGGGKLIATVEKASLAEVLFDPGEYILNGNDLNLNLSHFPSGSYILEYQEKLGSEWKTVSLLSPVVPTQISSQGVVKNIRVYPKGALMKSYEYIDGLGVSATISENHLISNYNFDDFERLNTITDKNEGVLERYEYNYGNQAGSLIELRVTIAPSNNGQRILEVYVPNEDISDWNLEWDVEGHSMIGNPVEYTPDFSGTHVALIRATDETGDFIFKKEFEISYDWTPRFDHSDDVDNSSYALKGREVTFDASRSSISPGTITKYEWVIDGSTKNGQIVSHSFSDIGETEATLELTNNYGETVTTAKTFEVYEIVPDFSMKRNGSAVSSIYVNQSVIFDASPTTTSEDLSLQYDWSFNESGVVTSNTFRSPGNINVHLDVSSERGQIARKTKVLTVVNRKPDAQFSHPNTMVERVQFLLNANNSSDPDGDELTYEWSFDGPFPKSKIVTQNPTTWVTIDFDGLWDITLKVIDPHGASDTQTKRVRIDALPTPHTVNGRITDCTGKSYANIEFIILMAGGSPEVDENNDNLKTDSNGRYSAFVLPGDNIVIQPVHSTYKFDPPSRDYLNVNQNLINKDFTVTNVGCSGGGSDPDPDPDPPGNGGQL